ncbi:MAG: class II aldolase/adducin family protein [Bacteroidales bacterium]|nr:class II aldolase/adducin family protein [Bacteroidales bacterium]
MNTKEGYLKFNCVWEDASFDFPDNLFETINPWRNKLHEKGLVGCNSEGIGYGNVSIKTSDGRFIITGTATGHKKTLSKNDYALITGYNISENRVFCTGRTRASAETMSHAAVYESNGTITSVIHIHQLQLWNNLKGVLPTTDAAIEYGTPQMAFEIMRLFKETGVSRQGIFVMGGHEEGIISFGKNLDEAGKVILEYFKSLGK